MRGERGENHERKKERRERNIYLLILIIIRIVIMEPIQGSTVTSDGLKNHLGNLLWDLFCDFLDIFPTYKE